MRFSYQALLSSALGLAAAAAALWVPLPGGTPLEHVLNRFLAIDDLRLVLSAGALVFGISALLVSATSFAAALAELGARARQLRHPRLDGAVSLEEWQTAVAGTMLEESALVVRPTRIRLSRAPMLEDRLEFAGSNAHEARTELRRLFWHRIARLQVWTATGILFAVGVLSLVYRRLGLDSDGSLVMLFLAPAGILLILVCALLARVAIGRRIKDFIADLNGPPAGADEVLPLTSEMRVARAGWNYRRFDPSLEVPPPLVPEEELVARPPSMATDAATADPVSRAEISEIKAALARILASLAGLDAQQRAGAQETFALRDTVRRLADRPIPEAAPKQRAENDRFAPLHNSLSELIVDLRAAQERRERELTAVTDQMRSIREAHERIERDLTGFAGEMREARAANPPAERDLAGLAGDLRDMRAAQERISQEFTAVAGAMRGGDEHRDGDDPGLAGVAGEIRDTRLTQERIEQEIAAFTGEMRDGRQSQQSAIGELGSSLNRLEARLVPILRHVAATNRAMSLLSERTGRLEAQLNKVVTDRDQAHSSSVVTPFRPPISDERPSEFAEMTSELRQLLSELEDAAPSDSQDEARAVP